MVTSRTPGEDDLPPPQPADFTSYYDYLAGVRLHKGLRLIDVRNASAHPDFPFVKAKMSALSRMEAGEVKNPSFRQIIYYARGYGVTLENLASFFKEEYKRAENSKK